MDSPNFHFISGLPRSGSTLLSAILRQNPRFVAGMTSPVGALVSAVLNQLSAGGEHSNVVGREKRKELVQALFKAYYSEVKPGQIVFDTNRMWCARLPFLEDLFPKVKVIACVRNVAWVMDSFERLYRSNPYEFTRLFSNAGGRSTIYSRLEGLAQHDQTVGFAWSALREAFYSPHAGSLLIVDYDLLCQAPKNVLGLIYQFLEEDWFEHDFDNVDYSTPEFDEPLGVPQLHTVRPKVAAEARRTILPPDLFEKYSQMSFWTETSGSAAHVIAPKQSMKESM